jgi:multidrug efflux pump subunit AcrB
MYPMVGVELLPQTDEGEVNVNAELGVGTRVERTEEALLKLEELVKANVPEAVTIITNGGGGGNNQAAAAVVAAARPTAARSASSWCRATSGRARTKKSPSTCAASWLACRA